MEAIAVETAVPRSEALKRLLVHLDERYGLEALVLVDEDGIVRSSTVDLDRAVRLAALAPGRLCGDLSPLREQQAPTAVSALRVDDELLLLAAVGPESAARLCLEEAEPWVRALLSF